MEILDQNLLKNLPQLKQGQSITLKLGQDISPELLGKLQRATILNQLTDGAVTLKLENGQELKATIQPQLPVGTRLTLLAKSNTDAMIRQILPPQTPKTAESTPLLKPSLTTLMPAQVKTITLPTQQQIPLALTLPATAPKLPIQTAFTATVLTPPTPQGNQTLSLTLPKPLIPQAATQAPVTAQATPPTPLPVQTTLTLIQPQQGQPQIVDLTLPPPAEPKTLPQTPSQQATPQPQSTSTQKNTPPTYTSQQAPRVHTQAPALPAPETVRITLPPPQANTPPLKTEAPLTLTLNAPAAPTPSSTPAPIQQTAPLPNGQQAVVTLPHAVPEGTTMTVRIGADGLPEVLRITADLSNPQNQGPQTRAHQDPQTPQNQPPSPQTGDTATTLKTPLLTAGETFKGIITAQEPNNQMRLSLTSGHTLKVHAEHPLPTGTQVTITIQQDGQAQIQNLTLPTGSERADAAYHLSKEWPLLKQALNVLRQHEPAQADKLTTTLPRPDTLLPTLTKFAEAIQSQSAQQFLGDDTVNILRSMGIDLTPDLQSLHQLHQRADTPDGWRAMLFPYVENPNEDPQQGGFFWRRQKQEDQNQRDHSLRFILQLRLSQFGPMQLDGLMNEKNIALHLYMQEEPGQTFRQDLTTIVQSTLSAYDLQGNLRILVTPTPPTDPLAEIQHYAGHMDLKA